jgi:hypothetical protein
MLIRTISPVRLKEYPSLAIIRQIGFLPTPQAASLTSLSPSPPTDALASIATTKKAPARIPASGSMDHLFRE